MVGSGHGARTLLQHRGFTAVAVLVLALGIGVNTAIFSLVNAVFLRPLPVRDPEQLRWVIATVRTAQSTLSPTVSDRDFQLLKQHGEALAPIAGYAGASARLVIGNDSVTARGERVSANYFDLLGISPQIGRTFGPAEDRRDSPPVIVIGHRLWRDRFDSDPAVLGREIALDPASTSGRGRRYTVVGVMPDGFNGLYSTWEPTLYWVPTAQTAVDLEMWCEEPERAAGYLNAIGRLKAGISSAQLEASLAAATTAIQETNPKDAQRFPGWSLVALDSRRTIPGLPFAGAARVIPERLAAGLLAVSTMLLLIAVANLTGVLMARGITRRGETAVRLMLGASPWRVSRQALLDGVMLATIAGLVGFWFAAVLIRLFHAATPGQLGLYGRQSFVDVPLDGNVVTFNAVLCVVTGVLVSLAPARQAWRVSLAGGMSSEGIAAPRRSRALMRHWIVIPQVCLSIVLLLVASALVQTLLRAELARPGYDARGIVFVDFDLRPPLHCGAPDQQRAERAKWEADRRDRLRSLLASAAALPQATDAVLVGTREMLPHGRGLRTWMVGLDGIDNPAAHRWVSTATVSPGYFRAFGIPLRGRDFEATDGVEAPRVAIVSEALAEQLWPSRDPIGEMMTRHEPGQPFRGTPYTVIGVVKEVAPAIIQNAPSGRVYFSTDQLMIPTTLVARARGNTAETIRALTGAIRGADDAPEIARSGLVIAAIAEVRYPRRMAAAILGGSGLIGLFMACLGLYGVVSFAVAQRVRELGIRAALGAARRDIVRLMMRDGVIVVLIGSAIGLILAMAAIRVTSATVVPLPTMEPVSAIVVAAALSIVVLAACYIPARRAASVDPVVALREL